MGEGAEGAAVAKKQVRVAGFGKRLLSTVWDGILVFFMSFVLVTVFGIIAILYESFNQNSELPYVELIFWTGLLLSIFYYAGMWSSSGQTIGKSMLGIRVVGRDGEPLSLGRALLRWVGYVVSGLVFSIGFLWINFSKQRRGWHDLIAGSYVIDIDSEFSDINAVEFVPADQKRGWVWIVLWVLIAISPIGLTTLSLFFLSPYVNDFVTNILGGLR